MAYYKYYSPTDYSIQSLKNNQIFFAHPSLLNDSFDTSDKLLKEYPAFCNAIRWTNELSEKLNKHAVFSMSEDSLPDNRYLWSHYAANYAGFAVEFDMEEMSRFAINNSLYISKVQYRECPLDLDDKDAKYEVFEHEDGNVYRISDCFASDKAEIAIDRLFEFLHLQKEKAIWEIENEARIIIGNRRPNSCEVIEQSGYKLSLTSKCVKKIILGYRVDEDNRKQLCDIAKNLGCLIYEAEPKIIDGKWDVQITELP